MIYLEDQLKQLNDKEKDEFIKILCDKYQKECYLNKIRSEVRRNDIINDFNDFNENNNKIKYK